MSDARQKTFVLVHGAYHGGWCWKRLARLLRARGHEVYTPTLTGLGERSHLINVRPNLEMAAEDLLQLIKFEELSEIILVGHSLGGLPVSLVADRLPSLIRHLVYLDATVLESGECAADRMPRELLERYTRRALEGDGVGIEPNSPQHYDVSGPAMSEWLESKLTPQPLQPYLDRLNLAGPVGNGLMVSYIACSSPFRPVLELSRQLARSRPDWRYVELAAGHNVMLTAPNELSNILEAID